MPDGSVYDGRFNLFGDLARAKWAKVKADDPKSMAEFYGVTLEAYLQGQKKEAMVLTAAQQAKEFWMLILLTCSPRNGFLDCGHPGQATAHLGYLAGRGKRLGYPLYSFYTEHARLQ